MLGRAHATVDVSHLNQSRAESVPEFCAVNFSPPIRLQNAAAHKDSQATPFSLHRTARRASWVFASKNFLPAQPGMARSPAREFSFRMSRPRRDDPRRHQLNVRFTAYELARIHHHASLTGKTLTDFGRAVMLRRPRARRKAAPVLVALSERVLRRWHALGMSLNSWVHDLNVTHQLPGSALTAILKSLRLLLRRSFPRHFNGGAPLDPYTLAPAVRYQLRKICTNLVQIADLYRALGLLPPLGLSHLISRFRTILNGDAAGHGA